jgi:hypothetical protein
MEICQAFLLGIMFAYMPGMIVLAILLRFRTYGALVGDFDVALPGRMPQRSTAFPVRSRISIRHTTLWIRGAGYNAQRQPLVRHRIP